MSNTNEESQEFAIMHKEILLQCEKDGESPSGKCWDLQQKFRAAIQRGTFIGLDKEWAEYELAVAQQELRYAEEVWAEQNREE